MTDEKVCSQCKGLRYREYEHGLIRLPCKGCQGTGSQEVATILKGDNAYAEEYDSGDDYGSFPPGEYDHGPLDFTRVTDDSGSPDEEATSEPELPKKRKTRRKSSK